jgi:hypothetical protein
MSNDERLEDKTRAFDDFGGVSGRVPGQAESRQARMSLAEWLKAVPEPPTWLAIWEELTAERAPMLGADGELALNEAGQARVRRRWNWRQALYIAWMATPRHERQPATLAELADLLGLSSTGTFRNWRRNDPEIDERIRALPKTLLLGHVVDVYAALVAVASDPDPKAFQDRRLFLEIAGEYSPKGVQVSAEASASMGLGFEEALQRAYSEADDGDTSTAHG